MHAMEGSEVMQFCMTSVFFWGQDFGKLSPEKYDFDLYKGFSMRKMTQVRQISIKIKIQIRLFLY